MDGGKSSELCNNLNRDVELLTGTADGFFNTKN